MSAPDAHPRLADIPLATLYERLHPITLSDTDPRRTFINWGLSYACRPLAVFEPENEYQCQLVLELARREGKPVRAAGVGHSPSDLACTSGFMLRTEKLDKIIEVRLISDNYAVALPSRHLSSSGRSPRAIPRSPSKHSRLFRSHSHSHSHSCSRSCSRSHSRRR